MCSSTTRVLQQLIEQATDIHSSPDLLPRNTIMDMTLPLAITGARSTGKTSALFLYAQNLQTQNRHKIFYFDLSNRAFAATTADFFCALLQETYSHKQLKNGCFLLDNVHGLPGWEHFVYQLYHQVSKHIIFTSTDSETVNQFVKHINLPGLTTIHLFPVSFAEYLRITHQFPDERFSQQSKIILKQAFLKYLHGSGLPEYILNATETTTQQHNTGYSAKQFSFGLSAYLEKIITDLAPESRQEQLVVHHILQTLLQASTAPISYTELIKKTQQHLPALSDSRFHYYINKILHHNLAFEITACSAGQPLLQQINNKLFYFFDHGLINALLQARQTKVRQYNTQLNHHRQNLIQIITLLHLKRQNLQVNFLIADNHIVFLARARENKILFYPCHRLHKQNLTAILKHGQNLLKQTRLKYLLLLFCEKDRDLTLPAWCKGEYIWRWLLI